MKKACRMEQDNVVIIFKCLCVGVAFDGLEREGERKEEKELVKEGK